MYYIGVDLGTSAMKLLLVDGSGEVVRTVSKGYELSFPRPGFSEQDPADWVMALEEGMKELMAGLSGSSVAAMGCAGQMHGLVALGEDGKVLRPCILWNDGRTGEETAFLNETVGRERLLGLTGNIAFEGFTAPKLLWMRKHEKELFEKIARILLPKDYLTYYLTGEAVTDFSDASGTLLLDVEQKAWSKEMLEICGVRSEQLPRLHESFEAAGRLRKEAAERLGLPEGILVAAGAGDNAAACIGTGTYGEGGCNISLGTSGTVFVTSRAFRRHEKGTVHAFAHADGGFHLMGCMLSAASCYQWLLEKVLQTEEYEKEQAGISREALGRNRVYFLPYLMGERSPLQDIYARGAFIGLSLETSRQDMVQAVLEGVAFAIRDNVEEARKAGFSSRVSRLSGGGAKSGLWQEILASVLHMTLEIPQIEEGPGYGAAMLAMVAAGHFESAEEASKTLAKVKKTVRPEPELCERYEEKYQTFRRLYPALKDIFPIL